MGKRNSSKTRVFPAFSSIKKFGYLKDFFLWVNENQDPVRRIPLENVDWQNAVVVFAGKDGKGEIGLAPSPSLLKWLILNARKEVKMPSGHDKSVSHRTFLRRQRLFASDESVRSSAIADAIAEINRGRRRGWFVLEGYSKPDVFIETNKFIFVVEGKRTERRPTDKTSFLPESRDQLARHMDCALEISVGKPVYGMTIFEKGHEAEFAHKQFDVQSVKHRSNAEVDRLAAGYFRPATWQSLQFYFQKRFNLNLGYINTLSSRGDVMEPYPIEVVNL